MSVARCPNVGVLRAIDAALWIADREEQRLMERIESKSSSATQRFRALVELTTFSRHIGIMLADSALKSLMNNDADCERGLSESSTRPVIPIVFWQRGAVELVGQPRVHHRTWTQAAGAGERRR